MKRKPKKKAALRLSVRTGRDNPASDLIAMGKAIATIGAALEPFPPSEQAKIWKRAVTMLRDQGKL